MMVGMTRSTAAVNYAGWQPTAGGAPSSVSVAGELQFLDSSDAVTTTYQAGDTLKLQVTDADRNGDAGDVGDGHGTRNQ